MTYHVVGIDLSLTHSAVVVFRGDDLGEPGALRPYVRSVLSDPVKSLRADGSIGVGLIDRRNRIQSIAARVVAAATHGMQDGDVPLFVVEAPLYVPGKTISASAHDRAWMWGLIVHLLFKRGLVVEVSTTTMKRYATGSGGTRKGDTSKVGVLLAMPHLIPAVAIIDDNEADAAVLGLMGCRALGHPREPSVQRCTPSALNAVEWPTDTARRALAV